MTGGAGQRALNRAFHDLFGVPRAFATVPMHGRTDPLIIADACRLHGVDLTADLQERYFTYLVEELPRDHPGKRRLPGVVELLDVLEADGSVVLGLLTGNLARSARMKLEHFDLWRYFLTGAFGDDAPSRNELVPVAADRMEALGYPRPAPSRTIVVGDTTYDVACARAAGVRSLAVATGPVGVDELRAAGADAVVEDLSRTADVLRVIETLVELESMAG
jgi:phosphoglycolate phosphatase-like HAD superfamily hydrolase